MTISDEIAVRVRAVHTPSPLNPCAWQGKASVNNGTCASYGFPNALGKDPVYNTTLWKTSTASSGR